MQGVHRQPYTQVFLCCFFQALELISNELGPEDPAPSQGNKNPAVLKYDPTGLRSTMSATNKAWEESLKVRARFVVGVVGVIV